MFIKLVKLNQIYPFVSREESLLPVECFKVEKKIFSISAVNHHNKYDGEGSFFS